MFYDYLTDVGIMTCLGDESKYRFLANYARIKLMISVFLS